MANFGSFSLSPTDFNYGSQSKNIEKRHKMTQNCCFITPCNIGIQAFKAILNKWY